MSSEAETWYVVKAQGTRMGQGESVDKARSRLGLRIEQAELVIELRETKSNNLQRHPLLKPEPESNPGNTKTMDR